MHRRRLGVLAVVATDPCTLLLSTVGVGVEGNGVVATDWVESDMGVEETRADEATGRGESGGVEGGVGVETEAGGSGEAEADMGGIGSQEGIVE